MILSYLMLSCLHSYLHIGMEKSTEVGLNDPSYFYQQNGAHCSNVTKDIFNKHLVKTNEAKCEYSIF